MPHLFDLSDPLHIFPIVGGIVFIAAACAILYGLLALTMKGGRMFDRLRRK